MTSPSRGESAFPSPLARRHARSVEAQSSKWFDELALLVGEVRQQRVTEQIDRCPQLGHPVRLGHERDQRAVDALEHIVNDQVLLLPAGRRPARAVGRSARRCGSIVWSSIVWCVVTTRQYDSQYVPRVHLF